MAAPNNQLVQVLEEEEQQQLNVLRVHKFPNSACNEPPHLSCNIRSLSICPSSNSALLQSPIKHINHLHFENHPKYPYLLGNPAVIMAHDTSSSSPIPGNALYKRKQVKSACVNCRKSCKKCEEQRPCNRCVRLGIQDSCTDWVRKPRERGYKRGPYSRKQLQQQKLLECDSVESNSSNRKPVHGSVDDLFIGAHYKPQICEFLDSYDLQLSLEGSPDGLADGYERSSNGESNEQSIKENIESTSSTGDLSEKLDKFEIQPSLVEDLPTEDLFGILEHFELNHFKYGEQAANIESLESAWDFFNNQRLRACSSDAAAAAHFLADSTKAHEDSVEGDELKNAINRDMWLAGSAFFSNVGAAADFQTLTSSCLSPCPSYSTSFDQ